MQPDPEPVSRWNGFLTHGLLWGIAIGYVVADLKSETDGMLIFGTTKGNQTFVTICLLSFSALGLILGYILDTKKISPGERLDSLKTSSRMLIISFIFYAVVALFANLPAVE